MCYENCHSLVQEEESEEKNIYIYKLIKTSINQQRIFISTQCDLYRF